ncbi:MAG: ATP-binding protein [Simkania sp.]|nr:ATP-binding protein [Simkania sp.]
MRIPKDELLSILSQFNPWWRGEKIPDLPTWKRAAFNELLTWVLNPPALRAVMLSGPRQVGKTTLLMQAIHQLIEEGISSKNILYISFDHPIFKITSLDAILEAWRELEPKTEGPEYLFLDEAQFIPDFGTWIKHQVDFSKHRRIIFTGSATPIIEIEPESGVGRWHAIKISTLSFNEYLQIKKIDIPNIPILPHVSDLFGYSKAQLLRISEGAQSLIGHFHEYLVHGGFPQTALIDSVSQAQRLLREDIIDKVLKRDMTALFGVRRVLELEQTFIFLCMHDGGLHDPTAISVNLGVTKPTVQNFIHLLESAHLVYRLPPFGYGKEVLRARYKLYLADPAIASAILMKGKTVLEDSKLLSVAVETAVFTHLSAHNASSHQHRLSYWRGSKNKEVDFIVEGEGSLIPIEVKYHSQITQSKHVQGLAQFSSQKDRKNHSLVLTKSHIDLGILENMPSHVMRIPSSIFCYWVGQAEISGRNILT